MKNILATTLMFIAVSVSAQVAIGKSNITTLSDGTTPNPGISLEFDNGTKGIIMPWVSTVANQPTSNYTAMTAGTDGTIIFDLSDYKMKYKNPDGWVDLTVKNKSETVKDADGNDITNNNVISAIQDSKTDKTDAKVMIGSNTSDPADGILVLTDNNKAMVLPLVNKYSDIQSPSAGMMVYDTSFRMLAVYNGTVWTFWKP